MALAKARGPQETPLLRETIGANLEATVTRVPHAEALVSFHQDARYTYAEFDARVNALARGLIAAGLAKGDRVGIWSPNCAEWVLVQYASAKAGVILVNINPAYRTSELAYALEQSGCRILISARAFKTSDYVAMLDEVAPHVPTLERVVFLGSDEWSELADGGGANEDELPDRSDASRRRADGHPGDGDRLWHDRNLAGVDAGPPRRYDRPSVRHGWSGA